MSAFMEAPAGGGPPPSGGGGGGGGGDKNRWRPDKGYGRPSKPATSSCDDSTRHSLDSTNGSSAVGGSAASGRASEGSTGPPTPLPYTGDDQEDLERGALDLAVSHSIHDSVGAYSVVPGERPERRRRDDAGAEPQAASGTAPAASGGTSGLPPNDVALPPNIDIVAVATLVEENDHDRGGMGGADAGSTLSASVSLSAITAPTVHPRESGETSVTSRNQSQQIHPMELEQGPISSRGDDGRTVPSSTLVHATPVSEGPFAFLETKGGKLATLAVLVLIAILTVGLSVGLAGGSPAMPEGGQVPTLARTSGNFCGASIPRVFYDIFPSDFCSREEVWRGGTLQQAIADAQLVQSQKGSENTVDVSLLNAGAVRGEIPADTDVSVGEIYTVLPFRDNTVSYLRLNGMDLIRVIRNAVELSSRTMPLDPFYAGAYPYASGLRYDVDLSTSAKEKVSNVRVYDSSQGTWIPLEGGSDAGAREYLVVTNSYVAGGGDGYLEGTDPSVNITDIGYTDEMVNYLRDLNGDWAPPDLDEMSTTSFSPP
ncbi:hypothetical protein ACHAXT_013170 [Thalassiosira profunda]